MIDLLTAGAFVFGAYFAADAAVTFLIRQLGK